MTPDNLAHPNERQKQQPDRITCVMHVVGVCRCVAAVSLHLHFTFCHSRVKARLHAPAKSCGHHGMSISSSNSVPSSCHSPRLSNSQHFLNCTAVLNEGNPLDERRKCSLCTQSWAMRTSPSSIGKHFKTDHHAIYMQRPYKDEEKSTSQQTLQACFNKADVDHSFDDVVDMFIHHPGLSLSLCDSPRFKKVLKLSAGASKVNFRSVRGAIIDKDEKLFAQLKAKLHGRKVGIQIDGGKTVSNTKILGICVVVDRQCFCFDVEEVDDASILTETYYCNLLLNLVSALESLGAIVVSITLDNEAAPNAGVRMLQRSKPHLIHNRCYPHTAELLVNDLQSLGTRQKSAAL